MSSTIGVCPDCGKIGAHADLPEPVVNFLKVALINQRLNPKTWSVRAYWCPHCEAVYVMAWSSGIDLPGRRALLAPPNEPLEINEDTSSAPPIPEADLFDAPAGDVLDQSAMDQPQITETPKKPRKGQR